MSKQTRYKIVIVEDEPAIADMYKMKLESDGFRTKIAENGEEGLSLIKAFKPDLVLLDLKMPIMNGDEMLERLRQTTWGANIRVIVLTNISRDEAPHNLRFLNVDRYIVKAHFTPTQVVEQINAVLGNNTIPA